MKEKSYSSRDVNYISHSLLRRRIVLLTIRVFASNHVVLYISLKSVWRGDLKKSVVPSVRPFESIRINAYSSIFYSTIIIRISVERLFFLSPDTRIIYLKKSNILDQIFEKCVLACHFCVIGSLMIFYIACEWNWCSLQEIVISKKKRLFLKMLDQIFKISFCDNEVSKMIIRNWNYINYGKRCLWSQLMAT